MLNYKLTEWFIRTLTLTSVLFPACTPKPDYTLTSAEKIEIGHLYARQEELNQMDQELGERGHLAGVVKAVCPSVGGDVILAVWSKRPRATTESPVEKGVYRSSDGGKSWTSVNSGLPEDENDTYDLIRHPQKNIFYVALKKAVYFTENYGNSWIPVTPEPQTDASGWFVRITLDPDSGSLWGRKVDNGFGIYVLPAGASKWASIGNRLGEHFSIDDMAYAPAEKAAYAATGSRGVIMLAPPKHIKRGYYRGEYHNGKIFWHEEKGLPISAHIPTVVAYTEPNPNTGEPWTVTYRSLFRKTNGTWCLELEHTLLVGIAFETGGDQKVAAWGMDDFFVRTSDGVWSAVQTKPWGENTWIYCAALLNKTIFVGTNRGFFRLDINGELFL